MSEFTYTPKVRNMDQFIISKEQKKQSEERMNTLSLEKKIRIRGIKINTIGEIKEYLKEIKDIERLEDYLEESDYYYLYNWLQFKLLGKIY
jgi:hypothetical protein